MSQDEAKDLASAPYSECDKRLILEELDCVLSSPRFSSSLRCSKLLQHLVRRVLEGGLDSLKERSLGLEVFGRDASYDTSSDPVVRITASEIRKRLTTYYQELESAPPVRIHLATGGYLPTFEFPSAPKQPDCDSTQPLANQTATSATAARLTPQTLKLSAALGCLLLLAAGLFGLSRMDRFRSTDYLIWKPLLKNTRQDIVLCISDYDISGITLRPGQPATAGATRTVTPNQPILPLVLMEDSRTAHKLTKRLMSYGRGTSLNSASELSLKQIRDSSLVLIGGLNNPWYRRLLTGMRYEIQRDPATSQRWVQDRQAPEKREWSVDAAAAQDGLAYAIITRFTSQDSGGPILALAGTGPLGVETAAELISAPWLFPSLPDALRTDKNFQVVLKAVIVNGTVGTPQIVSVYTW